MTIDKRVSIALLFAIAMEAAAGFLWAGQASARLSQVERTLADQGGMLERLARLEEQIQDVRHSQQRIERWMDRESGGRL